MVFEKIAEMIAEKIDCEVSEIQPDTKFSDLGIDSLDITELVMMMEDEFGVELEMDTSIQQVSELVALLESKLAEKN